MTISPVNMNNMDSSPQLPQSIVTDKQLLNSSKYLHSHILDNKISTKVKSSVDTNLNVVTKYPAKGLKAHPESNFYEFLQMGKIPFVIGGLTMIGVFNAGTKFFPPVAAKNAKAIGRKAALGVILYAVGKSLSGKLIDIPTKLFSGVDLELKYKKLLPLSEKDSARAAKDPSVYKKRPYEVHNVFESVDFTYWDMLNNYGKEKNNPNQYYDYVARKNGINKKLNRSDQMIQPMIKEKVSQATTYKRITSYLWAALGVMLAVQTPFEKVFDNMENFFKTPLRKRFKTVKDEKGLSKVPLAILKKTWNSTKVLGVAFKDSAKSLWKGTSPSSGVAGKTAILLTLGTTLAGMIAVSSRRKIKEPLSQPSSIDKKQNYMVQ